MRRFGGRDRAQRTGGSPSLTVLEDAMLGTVMNAFVHGLAGEEIRRRTIQGLAQPQQSLQGLFQSADQVRRT
jgi:hypothetical protein